MHGWSNIVCFKDILSTFVNDKWYSERKRKLQGEAKRIVETAIRIILADIRAVELSNTDYPTTDDITQPLHDRSFAPVSPEIHLKILVKSDIQEESLA